VTVRFELYAAGPPRPEDVWALVSDPRRLHLWTDAETVVVPAGPLARGTTVTTEDGRRELTWTVTTLESRLLELTTALPRGRLGIGVRVLRDPLGSRVVLAAAFAPARRAARLGFLLLGAPSLRRRFDRWSTAALRAAVPPPRDFGPSG
jgi:hypothetical protein